MDGIHFIKYNNSQLLTVSLAPIRIDYISKKITDSDSYNSCLSKEFAIIINQNNDFHYFNLN